MVKMWDNECAAVVSTFPRLHATLQYLLIGERSAGRVSFGFLARPGRQKSNQAEPWEVAAMVDVDYDARYLLRQAAENRRVTDEMVAELGLPDDVETFVVDQINSINLIRANGGPDASNFARGVAEQSAIAVEARTKKPARIQPRPQENMTRQERPAADDDAAVAVFVRARGW